MLGARAATYVCARYLFFVHIERHNTLRPPYKTVNLVHAARRVVDTFRHGQTLLLLGVGEAQAWGPIVDLFIPFMSHFVFPKTCRCVQPRSPCEFNK